MAEVRQVLTNHLPHYQLPGGPGRDGRPQVTAGRGPGRVAGRLLLLVLLGCYCVRAFRIVQLLLTLLLPNYSLATARLTPH